MDTFAAEVSYFCMQAKGLGNGPITSEACILLTQWWHLSHACPRCGNSLWEAYKACKFKHGGASTYLRREGNKAMSLVSHAGCGLAEL